jgi:hypothetical protein
MRPRPESSRYGLRGSAVREGVPEAASKRRPSRLPAIAGAEAEWRGMLVRGEARCAW